VTVLLRSPSDVVDRTSYDVWAQIPGRNEVQLEGTNRRPNVGSALEAAFDAEAATWWSIGRNLAADATADLAHTPACVANASDFGQMLAWTRLVKAWVSEGRITLLICDDPWVFRHLSAQAGVRAGKAPSLLRQAVPLALRGILARVSAGLRFAGAAMSMRRRRVRADSCLLVYGHPASRPDGQDAYFGDLMASLPQLHRVLHVDCPPERARQLDGQGRAISLHAWGNPLFAAFNLPFARWRPSRAVLDNEYRWLIRRASALEGGTAQAAAIAWQRHCHRRWLSRTRPKVVSWPWENHSWERDFVRSARRYGVRTAGYQHSVVGKQMLNYAAFSNPDGAESLPDEVLCVGRSTRDQLLRWGIEERRLKIAGALRFQKPSAVTFDRSAPIFVALPFDGQVARQMVSAARHAAATGLRFVIKDHPMTPYEFPDSQGVQRTAHPLSEQDSVSAVIYAATTVGLESALARIPTLRFRPWDRIALDILPENASIPVIEGDAFCLKPDTLTPPSAIDAESIFAPVDLEVWQTIFDPSRC
jgi:hypothetical protein